MLALIPLGLLVTGLAGIVLNDATSRADLVASIAGILPPLAGVVDEIVGGLSKASPSLSIVGLALAAWGTSRLFAALESGIAQMDAAGPRRSLLRRTARRVGSILLLGGILLAAVLAAPVLSIAVEMTDAPGPARSMLDILLATLPPLFGGVALAATYRLVPVGRPTWSAIALPAVVGAISLVVLTRVFVFVTPRIFGANLVFGTLGAILVSLAWLDLVFTIILIGSAWVRERMATTEAVVV